MFVSIATVVTLVSAGGKDDHGHTIIIGGGGEAGGMVISKRSDQEKARAGGNFGAFAERSERNMPGDYYESFARRFDDAVAQFKSGHPAAHLPPAAGYPYPYGLSYARTAYPYAYPPYAASASYPVYAAYDPWYSQAYLIK